MEAYPELKLSKQHNQQKIIALLISKKFTDLPNALQQYQPVFKQDATPAWLKSLLVTLDIKNSEDKLCYSKNNEKLQKLYQCLKSLSLDDKADDATLNQQVITRAEVIAIVKMVIAQWLQSFFKETDQLFVLSNSVEDFDADFFLTFAKLNLSNFHYLLAKLYIEKNEYLLAINFLKYELKRTEDPILRFESYHALTDCFIHLYAASGNQQQEEAIINYATKAMVLSADECDISDIIFMLKDLGKNKLARLLLKIADTLQKLPEFYQQTLSEKKKLAQRIKEHSATYFASGSLILTYIQSRFNCVPYCNENLSVRNGRRLQNYHRKMIELLNRLPGKEDNIYITEIIDDVIQQSQRIKIFRDYFQDKEAVHSKKWLRFAKTVIKMNQLHVEYCKNLKQFDTTLSEYSVICSISMTKKYMVTCNLEMSHYENCINLIDNFLQTYYLHAKKLYCDNLFHDYYERLIKPKLDDGQKRLKIIKRKLNYILINHKKFVNLKSKKVQSLIRQLTISQKTILNYETELETLAKAFRRKHEDSKPLIKLEQDTKQDEVKKITPERSLIKSHPLNKMLDDKKIRIVPKREQKTTTVTRGSNLSEGYRRLLNVVQTFSPNANNTQLEKLIMILKRLILSRQTDVNTVSLTEHKKENTASRYISLNQVIYDLTAIMTQDNKQNMLNACEKIFLQQSLSYLSLDNRLLQKSHRSAFNEIKKIFLLVLDAFGKSYWPGAKSKITKKIVAGFYGSFVYHLIKAIPTPLPEDKDIDCFIQLEGHDWKTAKNITHYIKHHLSKVVHHQINVECIRDRRHLYLHGINLFGVSIDITIGFNKFTPVETVSACFYHIEQENETIRHIYDDSQQYFTLLNDGLFEIIATPIQLQRVSPRAYLIKRMISNFTNGLAMTNHSFELFNEFFTHSFDYIDVISRFLFKYRSLSLFELCSLEIVYRHKEKQHVTSFLSSFIQYMTDSKEALITTAIKNRMMQFFSQTHTDYFPTEQQFSEYLLCNSFNLLASYNITLKPKIAYKIQRLSKQRQCYQSAYRTMSI